MAAHTEAPLTLSERLSLLGLAGAAWATYALTARPSLVWPYLVALAVSARFRARRLPPPLARLLGYALLACGVLTFASGTIQTLYPVVAPETLARVLHAMGTAFAVLVLTAAFDGALHRPALTLAGGSLGLLIVAALLQPGDSSALTIARFLPLSAAAIVLFLTMTRRTLRGSQDARTRRLVRSVGEGALMICLSAALSVAIIRVLPWAQPHIEGAIAGMMEAQPTQATTGMGDSSALGAIEELALSHKVVLRVWTPEPHNLRSRAHARFDGRTWRPGSALERVLEPDPRPLPEDVRDWGSRTPGATFWLPASSAGDLAGLTPHRIVQGVLAGQRLLAPANPVVVRAPANKIYLDATDLLTVPGLTTVELYGVLSRTGNVPVAPLTDAELRDCLSITHRPDPRLLELARDLGGETGAPPDRAARTVSYLQRHCRYSLRVGRFASADPVGEFVFDKRQGYCEYFASAAVILLRLQGVPARYVAGFRVSDLNRSGNHHAVRESDAHAWVEAFLPTQGWVEVDPTPAGDFAAVHKRTTRWWNTAWEAVRSEIAALSAALRSGDMRAALRTIVHLVLAGAVGLLRQPRLWALALLLLLAWRWRWRRAERPPAHVAQPDGGAGAVLPPELREALALMHAVWRRAGVARPPARGLVEQLTTIAGSDASASVKALSRDVAIAYYQAAFGGSVPPQSEQRTILQRARAAAAKR